ncbi:MAG: CvpA family protein [Armatimonadetes bacterium]|nr:CvpA family protein [Armatimonadota bacterium]
MNWVDWVIVAVLLIGVFQGVLRGWVAALVGIIVIAAAWLLTILLLPFYGKGVESLPLQADWARTIAFGVLLIGFYIIFSVIANTFLGGKRPRVEAQIAGGILGLGRGIAAAMVIVGLLSATPAAEAMQRDITASRLGKTILEWERQAMRRFPMVPPIGPDRRI